MVQQEPFVLSTSLTFTNTDLATVAYADLNIQQKNAVRLKARTAKLSQGPGDDTIPPSRALANLQARKPLKSLDKNLSLATGDPSPIPHSPTPRPASQDTGSATNLAQDEYDRLNGIDPALLTRAELTSINKGSQSLDELSAIVGGESQTHFNAALVSLSNDEYNHMVDDVSDLTHEGADTHGAFNFITFYSAWNEINSSKFSSQRLPFHSSVAKEHNDRFPARCRFPGGVDEIKYSRSGYDNHLRDKHQLKGDDRLPHYPPIRTPVYPDSHCPHPDCVNKDEEFTTTYSRSIR